MTSTLIDRSAPPTARPAAVPRRRTRVLALPEARWALAALVLFLVALAAQLLGAPGWVWGPLYGAVYVTGGWEPGWEGVKALRERTLDVDLLMVVAALGAAAIGQVLDGALLIVIFATSGALEAVATARTADSVRGLLDLAPATATRLLPGGREETVAVDALAVGDTVLVRPGERVGADGRVLDGESEVDQATITGEPLPAAKAPGDEVFAGTVNGTGALRVRVERDPSDSVIARIVRMVEEASETKAPTQLFIERVEQRYSLVMVAATVALFAAPLAFGAALQPTLLRAMTFMIVASPCAVVLATMPPLLSAIANAGRHGVLVKSAVVMERLGQVDAVALDKTGTLTEGTPRVTEVRPLPGAGLGPGLGLDEDALLRLAAAAERPSEHPLARAVVDAARARGLALPDAVGFTSTPGLGVRATVEGREVRVGAPTRLCPGEHAAAVEHAPVAKDHAVAADEHAAVTEEHTVAAGQVPTAEEHTVVADEHPAVADEHAAVAKEQAVIAEAHAAAVEEQALVAKEHAVIADEHAPVAKEQAVIAEAHAAAVEAHAVAPEAEVGAPDVAAVVAEVEAAGRTAVVVLVDGAPVGVLGLADRLRPGAAEAVGGLAALTGSAPVLLTGDNRRAADRLAAETGIHDVRAGLLPQDKVAAVREWADTGRHVMVVGDGVNDAPALAAAHTGVAMGRAGSDLALETADAVVVRDELAALPAVVRLSRTARRLVVQNLVIAGVCITALVVWDLAGQLPLPLGVAGHEGSTVLVGLNGLRLLREAAWASAEKGSVAQHR